MINAYRISHLAYDLRNLEVMEAFKKDAEGEMDRYYLSEEDRVPIRAKDPQPLLAAGVSPNVLRSLYQAMGLPPTNPPGGSRSLRGQDANTEQPTPEEAHRRKRVKEIQEELRLVDRG